MDETQLLAWPKFIPGAFWMVVGYAAASVTRYNDCGGSVKVQVAWLKR